MSTNAPPPGPDAPAGPSDAPPAGPAGPTADPQSFVANVPADLRDREGIIVECNKIVELFREGKISKAAAGTKIMQAIPTSFTVGGAGEQAFQAYLEILDQTAQQLANPGGGGGAGGRPPSRSPSPRPDEGAGGRRRRPRAISVSSSEDDEPNGKRKRIDESKLPWVVEDFIVENTLSPSLRKTRDLLLEFSKDPKTVLKSLLNSINRVAFPVSEWTAIVEGKAVNLDKVLGYIFSVVPDAPKAESVGGLQFVFGSASPTKIVTTQSDWNAAFGRTVSAILVVFPHRRQELEAYRQYISDLFLSCSDRTHERVILLDRKIRNEVAARRDLELSNFSSFGHWERAFLNDNGSGVASSVAKAHDGSQSVAGGSKKSKDKSPEPCRRFNDGRCPSKGSQCRYSHICSNCRRSHPVTKCDAASEVAK
ncbi:hypothetical protein R3P38DRAFT_2494480 [Favolaschia claudopus]|uniref:C3H1-type domain-containing protein n=1 Tax=Favolaschia claudopus TaxID=2862362 RepID=A0AAW0EFX6_9AGAR